jgi:hypothetical protein
LIYYSPIADRLDRDKMVYEPAPPVVPAPPPSAPILPDHFVLVRQMMGTLPMDIPAGGKIYSVVLRPEVSSDANEVSNRESKRVRWPGAMPRALLNLEL